MPQKKHKPDKIVAKLRPTESLRCDTRCLPPRLAQFSTHDLGRRWMGNRGQVGHRKVASMRIVILYASTALVFLALDATMLTLVLQPLFKAHLGAQLLEDFRLAPAAIFYLGYIGGVLWFVSVPALRADAPRRALIGGATLGAMAYGTYELTNFATLRDWHWSMVVVDLAWGAVLTGLSAWAGLQITRALTGAEPT